MIDNKDRKGELKMKTITAVCIIIFCIPALCIGKEFEFKKENYFEPGQKIMSGDFNTIFTDIADKLLEISFLQKRLEEVEKNMTPKGTVAAFDLDKCPTGWSSFDEGAGHVILGAGQGFDGQGNKLTERILMKKGGKEKVVLTLEQMPKHRHENATYGRGGARNAQTHYALEVIGKGDYGPHHKRPTNAVGEDEEHENMPPFVVLLFCKKN
jgi:hypothetical protein